MPFNQCGIDGQLPQAQPFAQHAQHAAARPQAHAAFRQLDHAVLAFHERRALADERHAKYIQMTKKMIELLINGYEYYENERKSKDDENN